MRAYRIATPAVQEREIITLMCSKRVILCMSKEIYQRDLQGKIDLISYLYERDKLHCVREHKIVSLACSQRDLISQ